MRLSSGKKNHAEELFEARKALRSSQGEIAPISGHVTETKSLPDGREQIRIEGEQATVVLPAELCQVKPKDQVGLNHFIAVKSGRKGRVELMTLKKKRFAIILDSEDAVIHLPFGVGPKVKDGQNIKEGAELTEKYELPPMTVGQAGKVSEIIEDEETGQKTVILLAKDEQSLRYVIPAGAELEVELDDKVAEGDLLS